MGFYETMLYRTLSIEKKAAVTLNQEQKQNWTWTFLYQLNQKFGRGGWGGMMYANTSVTSNSWLLYGL